VKKPHWDALIFLDVRSRRDLHTLAFFSCQNDKRRDLAPGHGSAHAPPPLLIVRVVVVEDEAWSSGRGVPPAVVVASLVARALPLVARALPLVARPLLLEARPLLLEARPLPLVGGAPCGLLLGGDEVYDGRDDGAVLGLGVVPVHGRRVADLLLQQDVQRPLQTL